MNVLLLSICVSSRKILYHHCRRTRVMLPDDGSLNSVSADSQGEASQTKDAKVL